MSADFLGVFGLLRRGQTLAFVANERVIAGQTVHTWDLPGGRVEPGETLAEALARELREELRIELLGQPEFAFYQEGERLVGGQRRSVWRSFFFEVKEWQGEPRPSGEVLGLRWLDADAMRVELTAPYHDSFRRWILEGGRAFASRWED